MSTPDVHRPKVEELVAHLTGFHACDHAKGLIEGAIREAFNDAAARSVEVPDGQGGTMRHVVVDSGALFDHPAWWSKLSRIHAEHSHDDERDLVPWHLHVEIAPDVLRDDVAHDRKG